MTSTGGFLRTGRAHATAAYVVCLLVAVLPSALPHLDGPRFATAVVWVLIPLLAYGAFVRSRQPLVLPILAILATVAGAAAVLLPAMVGMGLHARVRAAWPVPAAAALALAYAAGQSSYPSVQFSTAGTPVSDPLVMWLLNVAVLIVFPLTAGLAMRARRNLLDAYRTQAEQSARYQEFIAREAVLLERARIASEAHDVLGHKLALISLQAGGLEVNVNADPEALHTQAARIRQSARDALVDLRAIIHALEDDSAAARDIPPGQFRSMLESLVEESRASGADIVLAVSPEVQLWTEEPPGTSGRAARRILQECLTNALRHGAPGTVRLRVHGGPASGLTLEVRNPMRGGLPISGAAARETGGRGLVGMMERARLAGGHLTTTRDASQFVVTAWLPWPDDADPS